MYKEANKKDTAITTEKTIVISRELVIMLVVGEACWLTCFTFDKYEYT